MIRGNFLKLFLKNRNYLIKALMMGVRTTEKQNWPRSNIRVHERVGMILPHM